MRRPLRRSVLVATWLLGAAGLAMFFLLRQGDEAARHTADPTPAIRSGVQTGRVHAAYAFHAPDRPPDALFGLIGDMVVADDRRAYVLDVMYRRVAVFGSSGEQTAAIGTEGRGPGEFMGPVALALDDHDDLLVLDEVNQRIEVFGGSDGSWRRSIPVDFHPHDMCFLSGRLYVLGARAGYLLHEVSLRDGGVLRSFAPDSASRDGLVAGYRARGYLACGPGDEIAFLPSLRPDVVRYSAASGVLIASARIPGFQGIRVTRTRTGAVTFEAIGRKRNHYASSIVPLAGGDRLIQIGFLRRGSPTDHEFDSIYTYRLSGADGQIRPLGDQMPRVIAARGDSLYSAQTEPFPAVAVIPTPARERGR